MDQEESEQDEVDRTKEADSAGKNPVIRRHRTGLLWAKKQLREPCKTS